MLGVSLVLVWVSSERTFDGLYRGCMAYECCRHDLRSADAATEPGETSRRRRHEHVSRAQGTGDRGYGQSMHIDTVGDEGKVTHVGSN